MSFILDALRKSESERQRETAPSLTRTPPATSRRAPPVWAWLVIGLLALALVALAAAWWRTGLEPRSARPTDTFGSDTRDTLNPAPDAQARPAQNAGAARTPTDTVPQSTDTEPQSITRLADIDPALPDYALEFFAYSDSDPSGGNAWIDGRRYVPGQRIANGPEIVAIRRDGVLLSYEGRPYLLKPR